MERIKTQVQKYINDFKVKKYDNEEILAYIMKPR
jgi:hypothetical protein